MNIETEIIEINVWEFMAGSQWYLTFLETNKLLSFFMVRHTLQRSYTRVLFTFHISLGIMHECPSTISFTLSTPYKPRFGSKKTPSHKLPPMQGTSPRTQKSSSFGAHPTQQASYSNHISCHHRRAGDFSLQSTHSTHDPHERENWLDDNGREKISGGRC